MARKREGERSSLLGQVTSLTSSLSKSALSALASRVGGLTLDIGRTIILDRAQRRLLSEEQRAWMVRAGEAIQDARQTAGLSRDDLARALDLEDKTVLQAMEQGSATVSFDMILRLTSLLARNDPIPFLIQLVRGFNPRLWALAEDWGVGRLPTMVERDRKWINIYRGNEAARQLPEADFDEVIAFCESALTMAVQFKQTGRAPSVAPRPGTDDTDEPGR
ncbi:XRE family transcriptional regulator [Endozoicomonas sp. G2_2]|uniref:helix-turn-helix domain-containing protein n=1 Tax=Endozoicomonas sp. G2_2 TaxID=2821092 RepID=UPI001ADA8A56|nr:XRE family transcriptional regulator [Endozoicomonas sp. G2_2]MBO9468708.1 XRE family transcriptional regulator [Endozoicomonas sp. G2_2]